jgi:ketopantoate hydroxymethyltransferase
VNVLDFQKMKNEGRKISVVTCYDYSSARAVAASNIDCILVGDSVAMVMHGHATPLSATTAMIARTRRQWQGELQRSSSSPICRSFPIARGSRMRWIRFTS